MTEKHLLIKAKGGLGNRILSAVCGLILADLTHRRPAIDWRDGAYAPEGENAYPLLFDTPLTEPVGRFDAWGGSVDPAIWAGHLDRTAGQMIEAFDPDRHASALVYRRFCTDLSRLDTPEDLAVFWCYLPKFGRLAGHMRRDPRFARRPLNEVIAEYLTRYFTPNVRVRSEVEANLENSAAPRIGVHVRYTDRKVPVHRIEAALDKRLAEMPGATIMLATDNAAIQDRFAARYDNLRFTEKYLPPDGSLLHWPETKLEKVREAENALIDMQILGRCDRLVCSRHSTFAVTAEHYGGLSPAQVTDVDRLAPKIVAKRLLQRYL